MNKKIYTLIVVCSLVKINNAQVVTLSQAVNEPVAGNTELRKGLDSSGVIPRNTGANQVWNLSSCTINSVSTNISYSLASSVPSGTAYPTATLAQYDGTNYSFFKSSTNMYEMLAFTTFSATLKFTNTAVMATYPLGFNYSASDPVSGNVTSSFGNGTFTGTLVTNASGSGTVQLPGSNTYTDCLQVIANLYINAVITVSSFPVPVTISMTTYQYYNGGFKFPITTVTTTRIKSALINNTATAIAANNDAFVGINENHNSLTSLNIYPNPVSNQFNVSLDNQNAEDIYVNILNGLGQIVKSIDLGNTQGPINAPVNVSDLSSGMYYVRTNVGSKSTVKKLTIQ